MQRSRAAVPLRFLNQHLFIAGIGKTGIAAKIRSHFKAARNGAFWDVLESDFMEEVACGGDRSRTDKPAKPATQTAGRESEATLQSLVEKTARAFSLSKAQVE
jgi:hypothetical protein